MNSTIHILSEDTVNKIAAGEVIERPASVVKELVENSLDANAKKIVILLEDGGKELIKISDDGWGILSSEISKVWLRHTTSKISIAEDLNKVATMGFRGEAISSMAAVAEVHIETRHQTEETGVKLVVSNGKEIHCDEISRNAGTTISILNLFQHTPVRRKFLGSSKSESRKIQQIINCLSLSHPSVSFVLRDGEKTLLSRIQGTLEERIAEIFGHGIKNEMIEVKWQKGEISIFGYIGTIEHCRGRSVHQYFYLNTRYISSPMLSRALARGYDILQPGKFPICVLFISVPFNTIDVNVHPAKKEIRFLDERSIFSSMVNSVRESLKSELDTPYFNLEVEKSSQTPTKHSPEPQEFKYKSWDENNNPSHTVFPEQTEMSFFTPQPSSDSKLIQWPGQVEKQKGDTVENSINKEYEVTTVPYLQLHFSYILFEVKTGLMVVNQKSAHERILYEQALKTLQSSEKLSS